MKREPNWATSFQLSYSNDSYFWITLKNKNDQTDRIFMGNYDSETILEQYFDNLIHARYIKLTPVSWNNNIGLRFEIIGCYDSVISTTPSSAPIIPIQNLTCNTCPGLPSSSLNMESCLCQGELNWDGSNCVQPNNCPCYYNSIR